MWDTMTLFTLVRYLKERLVCLLPGIEKNSVPITNKIRPDSLKPQKNQFLVHRLSKTRLLKKQQTGLKLCKILILFIVSLCPPQQPTHLSALGQISVHLKLTAHE